jgi:O-antigen ligase
LTDAIRRAPGLSWLSLILSARHDPAARIFNIDLLTVLIAILLPWSTTGVAVAAMLWIIALLPTIEPRALLRSLMRPVSLLPIAIFALALVGTLWSEAPWDARLAAISPAAKLLVLPLLLYHFERSPRGVWVFVAFLASSTLLMLASWLVAYAPNLSLKPYLSRGPYAPATGIVVKNYIDQSQDFALCAMALASPILIFLRTNRIWLAALCAALALGFLANMVFVVISRTALVTMPVMAAVFALLHLRPRTAIAALCAAALLAAAVWSVSPRLQATVAKFSADYRMTAIENSESGIGSRLLYWQRSLQFIAESPVIGHGTGSTRGLFERAAIGEVGARALIVGNPHNQTLAVAIQWGVLGVVVLYAMWWLHLRLFRGEGLAAWIGLMVVVQNIFTSLFNSHLFDFHQGWLYVLGVGVAGGMALGQQVIPGRIEDANLRCAPHIGESRDSGSRASRDAGMTVQITPERAEPPGSASAC